MMLFWMGTYVSGGEYDEVIIRGLRVQLFGG
jgi:hypothetical protein